LTAPFFSFSGVFMRKIMTMVAVGVAAVAALAVAACGSPKDANKANFSKAIQAKGSSKSRGLLFDAY
jgi:spermidine/putrescine-binding protein